MMAQVCVYNNNISHALTVNVHLTASDGSDYLGVSMDLVFTAGTSNGTMQCMDVALYGDSLFEGDETFTVTLTLNQPSYTVVLGNNMTTITILDNDGMYVVHSNNNTRCFHPTYISSHCVCPCCAECG